MFLSTLIMFCLPLEGCTTSYKEANVLAHSFEWVLSGDGHYLEFHTDVCPRIQLVELYISVLKDIIK